jgi:hypothetical protein
MVNESERLGKWEPSKLTVGNNKLPPRTESIVKLPVTLGSPLVGLINRRELHEGVILAASLTRVMNGYAMTSVLNVNDEEVNVQEPIVALDEVDATWDNDCGTEVEFPGRESRILTKLRVEHLNAEEKKSLVQTCLDYQTVFYLPGDQLSSTGAVRHKITVEPGTEPVNTRPYRLPEMQEMEVGEQVKKLLREGIIEESNSPWNSPILLVPKKLDASGQQKFRLVVDYRKLNERTVGNAYPLPDITEILDQLGQAKYFSCLDLAMGTIR